MGHTQGARKPEETGVNFSIATQAFHDPLHVITRDPAHSIEEKRYFCYGKVENDILTIRFTYRGEKVRIIGEAYWKRKENIW